MFYVLQQKVQIRGTAVRRPGALRVSPAAGSLSVGQSCSAAVTSVLQNLAAVGGRHSLSEAMDFFSEQFLRLVSSLHCICLLLADR